MNKALQSMTPQTASGKTVAGGGVGAALGVIAVVCLSMADVGGLTPDRASLLTGALGTVFAYGIHRYENRMPVKPK